MSQRKKDKRSHRNDFYRGEEKSEARTLFNPQSDHPIDFNKSDISNNNNSNNNVKRKAYSSQRQHSTEHASRTTISKDFLRNNEREATSTIHLPDRPTNGVLWDPNSKESNKKDIISPKSPSSPKQQKQRQQSTPVIQKKSVVSIEASNDIVEQNTNSRIDNSNINNKVRSTKPSPTLTERTTTTTTAKPNNNNNNQRTRLKSLIHRVSHLESQIDQLSKVTKQNPYFRGIHQESGHNMSHPSVDSNLKIDDHFVFQRGTPDMFQSDTTTQLSLLEKLTSHPWLNMNKKDENGQVTEVEEDNDDDDDQWKIVDQLWKNKMKLHIQLANTYLDIMQLDYEYSEKKNLEGLCWKRAIYSLVEEFRHAIRRQQSLMILLRSIEKSMTNSSQSSTTLKTKKKQKVVADKDGIEKGNNKDDQDDQDDQDDDDDDDDDDINGIETTIQFEAIDGIDLDDFDDSLALPVFSENGMTMLQLSDDDDDESKKEYNKRQNITTACRVLDKHLNKLKLWMGTFLTLSDEFYQRVMAMLWTVDEPLLKNEIENDTTTSINVLSKNLHSWQRNQKWKWYKCITFRGDLARYRYIYVDLNTYQTAWRWYTLGAWLMPTTGRFYFHQSLLLNSPQYSSLYEFHKLYFSVKSLMVRRNPFVNSREGLVGLFENNRQWYSKVVTTVPTLNSMNKKKNKENFKNRKGKHQLQQKQQKKSLGMKAIDFNSMVTGTLIRLHGMLFTKIDLDTFAQTKRHYFDTLFSHPHSSFPQPISSSTGHQPSAYVTTDLNDSQLYWLESIILNISSLYNFNYSTSPLAKLLFINKRIWLLNNKEDKNMNDDDMDDLLKKQQEELHQFLETLKDSILFSYAIDLVCQTAVELLSRYVKYNDHEESALSIPSPSLPTFPSVSLSIQYNKIFLFGKQSTTTPTTNEEDGFNDNTDTLSNNQQQSQVNNNDNDAPWFIYIELLLQWMLVSGICIRTNHLNSSIWELLVGRIILPNERHGHHETYDDESKIVPSFWPLLMSCFTKLLHSLSEELQYKIMNWYLMNNDDEDDDDDGHAIYRNKYITHILKMGPSFPEEEEIRGLGWMDDLFVGKYQDSKNLMKEEVEDEDDNEKFMVEESRCIRILNYGFWLVKQMSHVLEFDPVNKVFLVNNDLSSNHSTKEENITKTTEMLPILTAMDDAVLFESDSLQDPTTSNDENNDGDQYSRLYNDIIFNNNKLSDDNTDKEEEDDDDGMMGQLKKRREQLQSMINTMTEEKKHLETFGYQPLSNRRVKERELRLNRLREKVIPGQTVLVFDTNCFIGHLETIRKLFQGASWSIVIPLVVVTELDGLKGNAPPLGTIADDALKLIETTLAKKPRRDHPSLRIQTSHHNFLYDISIRSEQFVFGETDKNLDDLVLSTCLWWMKKQQHLSSPSSTVPVCLVTADRNLSVKARARDVQVIPVSGLIEINP